MWRVKCCPRCGGDLFIDRDFDGWHEQCLQCAYHNELRDIAELQGKTDKMERELVRVRSKRVRRG